MPEPAQPDSPQLTAGQAAPARNAATLARDLALDVVKGLCVLVMIIHHSINYYPSPLLPLTYFRFVSGAFVFLAGFVATHIYEQRLTTPADCRHVSGRLLSRGVRLLAVYLACNAVILLLGTGLKAASVAGQSWLEHFVRLLATGNYRNTSFALLLPISYVLVFVGACTTLGRGRKPVLVCATVGVMAYCAFRHVGSESGFFVRYFSIGLLGATCGLAPAGAFSALRSASATMLLFALCFALVVPFIGGSFPAYTANVAASLAILYCTGGRVATDAWPTRFLVFLGRFTLLAYLSQIAVLRLAKSIVPARGSAVAVLFAVAFATASVWLLLVVTDWVLERSPLARQVYRAVFA